MDQTSLERISRPQAAMTVCNTLQKNNKKRPLLKQVNQAMLEHLKMPLRNHNHPKNKQASKAKAK